VAGAAAGAADAIESAGRDRGSGVGFFTSGFGAIAADRDG
jgi:hypothetical protein